MPIDVSGEDRIEAVGESFYRAALNRVATARDASGLACLASLVRDPTNPYDNNAVVVSIDGEQVGHLPRELAALVAGPLDELAAAHGQITAHAEIRGDGSGPGFGVVLHLDLDKLNVHLADDPDEVEPRVMVEVPDRAGASQPAESVRDLPRVDEAELARRRPIIEKAVENWKTELIDLSGRNRLLFMRDLKTGSLSFDESARDPLMQLVAGKRVALSKIVSRSKMPDNPAARLSPFEDAVRRMRAIVRTARSYEEERGVRTLFLACGIASWRNDRTARPPASPVLLVPLSIRARGASQQDFDLSIAGDLEVNPTLLHMLKVEFNLEVDERELYEHSDMDGIIDTPEELRVAFNWLSERCASVPGWTITDRFVLGNFWYAKLPMVRDLEASIDALAAHDVATAFAGDSQARRAVVARRSEPTASVADVDQLAPSEEFNVLDSDSSQSLAIARARQGENLVLKGPPGTGKSQTIANLICNAIGAGKRVLFVAEKRAAIEAVTKRLNGVGLGDLVLDLHRGAESRKWLAAQLKKSLEAVRTAEGVSRAGEEARLTRARQALGAHAEALHAKHPPWNMSLFDAQMEVLSRGQPAVAARLRGPDLEALNDVRYGELDDALRDLEGLGGLSLTARNSPWVGAAVTSSESARETEDLVSLLSPLIEKTQAGLTDAARATSVRKPVDLGQAAEAVTVWDAIGGCSQAFDLALLEGELDQMVAALAPLQGSGIARLVASLTSGDYRAALAFAREHAIEPLPEPGELYARLVDCRELQRGWRAQSVGSAPLVAPPGFEVTDLRADLDRLREAVSRFGSIVGGGFEALTFGEMSDRLKALAADIETVRLLPRIIAVRSQLESAGLGSFLAELEDRPDLASKAREELDRLRWRSIADHLAALPAADVLAAFRGELHAQVAAEFREMDRDHVEITARRVQRGAAEAAVAAQDKFPDQAQLVKAQAARKRGHMPVRELFAQAPDVLTALRPCWVMSPLMVSQLIPSERAYFDLIVFDEASQVRPVEALTSVIRGAQLVVAGDERQLPPTAFFDAAAVAESEDPGDEDATELADYESLLDVLMTMFEMEMLRWHYRSRDERLIGFSNHEIYGGGLTTFPGVVEGDVLRHVLIDEVVADGGSRVSPEAEVKRVVDLVVEHARERPDESLGVIALGIVHAEAIDAALLAEMPNHPDLEQFFAEDREERFFVKNLERVQGDERDAIILAIGYGKNPDGVLPHNFGPINKAGGERRLNVAVTRAKRRMTVVSSFAADDVDPKRSSAEGVRLLRAFLAYASAGGEVDEGGLDGQVPGPLHEQIAGTIRAAGFEPHVLHGSSGDRVDIAVVDRGGKLPLVAVEIDGDTYARRPSVRDRDRLRSEQLERLGWRYVSTWSQDWYRDPVAAARELLTTVEAKFQGDGQAYPGGLSSSEEPEDSGGMSPAELPSRGPRPPMSSGGAAITDWTEGDLLKLATWIESDGLLRTADELRDELMREIGITRRGSRVVRILDQVVAAHRG